MRLVQIDSFFPQGSERLKNFFHFTHIFATRGDAQNRQAAILFAQVTRIETRQPELRVKQLLCKEANRRLGYTDLPTTITTL